jgi:peptidoglycan/LPS O-acetylase OafA/YrhL
MWAVPLFFIAVIAISGLLGELVGRFYSEPTNRRLRTRWRDGAREMGSVVEAAAG